ncbi:hypothetical protein QP157_21315 [Sphingomonas sp. LR61]
MLDRAASSDEDGDDASRGGSGGKTDEVRAPEWVSGERLEHGTGRGEDRSGGEAGQCPWGPLLEQQERSDRIIAAQHCEEIADVVAARQHHHCRDGRGQQPGAATDDHRATVHRERDEIEDTDVPRAHRHRRRSARAGQRRISQTRPGAPIRATTIRDLQFIWGDDDAANHIRDQQQRWADDGTQATSAFARRRHATAGACAGRGGLRMRSGLQPLWRHR